MKNPGFSGTQRKLEQAGNGPKRRTAQGSTRREPKVRKAQTSKDAQEVFNEKLTKNVETPKGCLSCSENTSKVGT